MARKYSKSNFVDAVKIITPDVYLEEDLAVGGQKIKYTDQIINSHLVGLENISTANDSPIGGQSPFLHLSSIPNNGSYSSIDTPEGFSRYFIKQNNLTNLTPQEFDKRILSKLSTALKNYDSSSDFEAYVSSTLLPKFTLNSSSLLADNTGVFGTTLSGIHDYFIDNLGWLYFLNTSGPIFDPSSLVLDRLVNTIYGGTSYRLNDAIKDYQTYVWKNYYDYTASDPAYPEDITYNTTAGFNALNAGLIPAPFASAIGTFTSGTQNLEKLNTFIDIIYSPLYIDRKDNLVQQAIGEFLNSNSRLSSQEEAGPFSRYLQAVSYLLRDLDNEVESLETLLSIQDCPVDFLPYLASLVGWELYGADEVSWRLQLSNAVRLYKKRGTKEGLEEALDTVIVQNPLNTSGSVITELYESYIPNLLYYLLLTDSPLFNFEYYTPEVAQALGVEAYSAANMDINLRAAVDSIIKSAIEEFPHLFINRNEPFRIHRLANGRGWFGDIIADPRTENQYVTDEGDAVMIKGDPNFVFNYRTPNHVTQVPPWEEEKFYKNCGVTSDLLNFYAKRLRTFCVSQKYSSALVDYVTEFVLGITTTDLYLGNSYVFFTSAQEYSPNHDHILTTYQTSSYDALSLWNGKSSTFDLTIGAGAFSSTFFQDVSGQYTVQQIVDTLRIVDDFSPAKAIPRTRIFLTQEEHLSGIDFMCPSIRWGIADVPPVSGPWSNTEVSGVDDRGTGYALGYDIFPAYDDSRSTVSHEFAPCFHRKGAEYALNMVSSVVNTSAIVPQSISRNTVRRRNFYNTLNKKSWYDRTGWNMPSFYNAASSIVDYYPLGLIPSSFSFADGSPHNLSGVYARDCNTSGSNRSYFGVPVSGAFLVRGNTGITFSSCDSYVRRCLAPPEVLLFFNLEEKKKKALAYATYKYNESLLTTSSAWLNFPDSLANRMDDVSDNKYQSPVLDRRRSTVDSSGGVQSVYNDYNEFFGTATSFSSLPENLIKKHKHGGANILSHVYGPIYRNADFYYDGSAVLNTSSNLVNRTLTDPFVLNLALSGANYTSIGVTPFFASSVHGEAPYFGFPEYRTQFVLSGVNFIDSSSLYGTPANEFLVYQLGDLVKSTVPSDDNYLINNKCLMMKKKSHGLPRFSIDLRGSEDLKNILIPEHDFELSVDYLIGNQEERSFGGGGVGVILRTKVEPVKGGGYVFFVWTPQQRWEMVNVNDVTNGYTSIDTIINNYTHIFAGGDPSSVSVPNECTNDTTNSLLSRVNKNTFKKGKVRFHTRNMITKLPIEYGTYLQTVGAATDVYNGRSVQLHRAYIDHSAKTQNYFVEVFPLPTNSDKQFALFDKINVVDTTLNEAACIPYNGNIVNLNPKLDTVDRTTFYTSKGDTLDFQPIIVGSRNDESTADIFTINPRLWQTGNTSIWNSLPPDATLFQPWAFSNSSQLLKKQFLLNYPLAGASNSLWATNDAPWGRIPFTGLVNTTWTTTPTGFPNSETTAALPGEDNLTFSAKTEILKRYWEDRKGFCAFDDWNEYITVGERNIGFAPDELGPGKYGSEGGVCWWSQELQPEGDPPPPDPMVFPIRPLMGVARSGHSYSEQNKGTLAVANPFGRIPSEEFISPAILNGVPGVVSVGATQEVDFTSRRRNDEGIWSPVDPLLPTIVDPLGYVTSATAFKNLINITLDANPTSPPFDWQTSSVWVDEGHAITFPPLSVYRDIKRDRLIHGKEYTFAIHVASPGSYISAFNYAEKIGFATSAILTIAPIGSSESYTRLTLRLPRDGTPTDDLVASSIQTNGHTLTGDAAARITSSGVNPLGGYPTALSDNLMWYRMEVTIPYNSQELDSADKTNLGLRCSLQAYNDYWDEAFEDGEAANLSYEYFPCRLWTWGPSLHAETSGLSFVRYPQLVYAISRLNGGHWGAWANTYATANTMVYNSINNILEEETVFPKEVYNKDDELYMYNKEASGLSKLTVAQDVANNTYFASKLYNKVQLFDSSGNLYDGDITLSPDQYLIREKYGDEEASEFSRRLTVSGTHEGSNILKSIVGKILLEPKELIHLFQYFNKLGKQCAGPALNTRVAADAAAIHDLSGGSRLTYRINPDNPNICLDGINTTFKNYTILDVNN